MSGPTTDGVESACDDTPTEHDDSLHLGTVLKPSLDGPGDAAERNRVFEALFQVPAQTQTLGRYVVLGTLGKGGTGTVLDAFDRTLDRRVAVKVLHEDLDERHTTRLLREAQALAKLSHPNVVQVYEADTVSGRTFLAMELVSGQTLHEWMKQDPPPDWRASVEVFIQVGLGLAAAHGQRLIHRDFKPGNAIVDEEGRARVLDFGLARRATVDSPLDPLDAEQVRTGISPHMGGPATGPHRPFDLALTQTGAMLGTPAYMPPEQMQGREADARSDQFSFCVSLWEALYGERPFDGSSMMALMVSMNSGEVRPAPKGRTVPEKLREVVRRGLAADPAQRWASMEALLEQLRSLVAPRSSRGLLGGMALGLACMGAALAVPRVLELRARCTGARAQLDGTWDETRRQQVKDAILGTALSYAEGTWQRVEPQLDHYAQAWADQHTEICEATAVRAEQTPEMMNLRMGCLRTRRTALETTVDVLAQADPTTVENAVASVTALPALESCDDIAWLEQRDQRVPPPEDPQVAQEVETVRDQLAAVAALQNAGRYDRALTQATELVQRAEALTHPPLRAEALYRWGALLEDDGRYDEAEQALLQAHSHALEHGHDSIVLAAAQSLTEVVGLRLMRHAEGRVWAKTAVSLARYTGGEFEHARSLNTLGAVLDSLGQYEDAKRHHLQALRLQQGQESDPLLVAASLHNLGNVFDSLGDYEAAKQHHLEAIRIQERALGPEHPSVATSLQSLAVVLERLGEYDHAKQRHLRAIRIQEQAFGSDHPVVATSYNNLGIVFDSLGEYERATQHYRRALRINEKTQGPDHPDVAMCLNNLGNVLSDQGDYERAKLHFQRALRINEKAQGSDHPDVAISLNNLGTVYYRQGKYELAERHYRRAMELRERVLGGDHLYVAESLNNVGMVLEILGEPELAKAHHQRALQIVEAALGPEHPDVAMHLNNLASAVESLEDYPLAEQYYARALRIREQTLGVDHPRLAYSLLGLAGLAISQRNFETARAHAERAIRVLEQTESMPSISSAARFLLARALWNEPGQRVSARALAAQVRSTLAQTPDSEGRAETLAEIDAWLATHRLK